MSLFFATQLMLMQAFVFALCYRLVSYPLIAGLWLIHICKMFLICEEPRVFISNNTTWVMLLVYKTNELSFAVWGQCNHAFHLHCILKWVNSQTSQAHCPMCRREWHFKDWNWRILKSTMVQLLSPNIPLV